MAIDKSSLKHMEFFPLEFKGFTIDESHVEVQPNYYSRVLFNTTIAPGSPDFWGMVLRAGFVHYQYHKLLVPTSFKFKVWAPRRPPRANRKETNQDVTTKEA